MSENVKCLKSDEPIAKCLAIFMHGGIRHVPVLNKDESLLGVISIKDIVKKLRSEY